MEDKLEKILQEYSFKEILTKVKNFGNDPKKTEKVATHAKRAIDHMAHNLGFISSDSLKKDYKSSKVDFGMVKRSAESQPEMSDLQASPSIKKRLMHPKSPIKDKIANQEKENQILKDKKIRNHPAQNLEVGKERAGQAEINRRKELYSKPYRATAREDRQVDANFAKWTSKKNKPTIESIVDKYLSTLNETPYYTADNIEKRVKEGKVPEGYTPIKVLKVKKFAKSKANDTKKSKSKTVSENTKTIVANFAKVRQQLQKSKQETSPSIAYLVNKISGAPKNKLAPGSDSPNNPERVSSKIARGVPFATQTATRMLRGDSGEKEAAASYFEKPTFQRNKMNPKEQTDLLRGAINHYVKKEESVLGEELTPEQKKIRSSRTKEFLKGEIKSDGSYTAKGHARLASTYGRINRGISASSVAKELAREHAVSALLSNKKMYKHGSINTLTRGSTVEKAIIDNFLSNLAEADHKQYPEGSYKKRWAQQRSRERKEIHKGVKEHPGSVGGPHLTIKGLVKRASRSGRVRDQQAGEYALNTLRAADRDRKLGDVETLTRGFFPEKRRAVKEAVVSEADHKKYKKGLEKQGAQTRATNAKMVHHGEMEPTNSKYKQGKLTPKGEYKDRRSKERENKKSIQTEDTLTGDVAIMPMPFKAVGLLKDLHKKKKHKKGIIAAMMGAATTGS